MKDNLKEFIQTHREDFDDQLAPELWASISAGIKPPSHLFINLKKLANMFKYAFGASALIIGTFFIWNSLTQNKTSHALISQSRPLNTMLSSHDKTANDSFFIKEEIKPLMADANRKDPVLQKKEQNVPPEQSSLPTNSVSPISEKSNPLYHIAGSSMIVSHSAPSGIALPTDMSGQQIVDTLFKGVKNIVVKGNHCNISIVGNQREDVAFKGNVSNNKGEIIIQGIGSRQKTMDEIKFTLNEETLTVWVESVPIKKGEKKKEKIKEGQGLHFEVPIQTHVLVESRSGNIEVSTIDAPKLTLISTFGDIAAKTITAEINIQATSGNSSLHAINGNVKINSSSGTLQLEQIKGDITLKSSSGDIIVKQLVGNADVTSTFGFQKFVNLTGNLKCLASSGNIEVHNLIGNLISKSSFGNQDLESILGDITATASSGDLEIESGTGVMLLNTTFGNISGRYLRLLGNSHFTSSSGNITIQLLNDISELSFDLASSSGDLEIKKGSFESRSEKKLVFDRGPIKIKGVSSFGNQHYK